MGYMTVTMVDYLGAIPYSQAVNNAEFPNPELDGGAELYQTVLGDIDEAMNLNHMIFPLNKVLFIETSPSPVKYALSKLKRCRNIMRLPMVSVSKETAKKIEKVLEELKLCK